MMIPARFLCLKIILFQSVLITEVKHNSEAIAEFTEEGGPFFCPTCSIANDGTTPMVCCDSCDNWYHFSCVGFDQRDTVAENQVNQSLRNEFETQFQDYNKKSGNLKKIKVPFHLELSHRYQTLMTIPDSHSFRTMNNYTKIILNPLNEMIAKLQKEYKRREIPMSIYLTVFRRFSGLRLSGSRRNSRNMILPTRKGIPKKYNKDTYLKLKIKSWLTKLIGNKDIMFATYFNENLIFQTLSKLGSKYKDWKDVFYRKFYEEQEMLDVGLVRFPDFEAPFFLFYKLRINVYRKSKKYMMLYQIDQNGVRGSIEVKRYVPDEKTKKILNLDKLSDNESKRAENILMKPITVRS